MLFSRADRTFQLELVRDGRALVEREHVGDRAERRAEHADEHAAIAAFGARVAALIDDGWTVAWVDADAAWPVARHLEMEAAIDDAGDGERDDRLAVYTDWLLERGDPCGERAALGRLEQEIADACRAESDELEARFFELEELRREAEHYDAAHGPALYGSLSALARGHRDKLRFSWHRGWIEGFEMFEAVSASVITLAFHAPMARFVQRLLVRQKYLYALPSVLAMSPRRDAIRFLELTARAERTQELLDALPGLEHVAIVPGTTTPRGHAGARRLVMLHVSPQLTLAEYENALPHHVPAAAQKPSRGAGDRLSLKLDGAWPALEQLTIGVMGSPAPRLEGLALADTPALTSLVLRGRGRDVSLMVESLLAIPTSPFVANLQHLAIDGPLDEAPRRMLGERLRDLVVTPAHPAAR